MICECLVSKKAIENKKESLEEKESGNNLILWYFMYIEQNNYNFFYIVIH